MPARKHGNDMAALMMSPLQTSLLALALCLAIGLVAWVCSVHRTDASLADRAWPLAICATALIQLALLSPGPHPRINVMVALCVTWALRLGIFITVRNWGHGEDRRYREMRLRTGPTFRWRSLYLVFGLQAVLAWMVSLPFLAASLGAARPWGWMDATGAAVATFGVAFEAIGDAQLARFKADPANHGRVMDRGLWRITRHPNYFGEFCVWWGLWLMAIHGAGWAGTWSIISPLTMTILLLKVSGVELLEKDIAQRRSAYADYVARTNAFFPGPQRNARALHPRGP